MSSPSAPGWHPDPWGEAPLRWWDGTQWSGETTHVEAAPAEAATGPTDGGVADSAPFAQTVSPTSDYSPGQQFGASPPSPVVPSGPPLGGTPWAPAEPTAAFGSPMGGPKPPQSGGGSKKGLLIGGGALAALALVAGGVVLATRGGGDDVATGAGGSTNSTIETTATTAVEPPTTQEQTPTSEPPVTETTEGAPTTAVAPGRIPSGTVATRENPAPLGSIVDLEDGWSVSVISFDPRATIERLGDEAPEPGNRYVLAVVEAVWSGGDDEPTSALFSLNLGLVGSSNVSFDSGCGFLPGSEVLLRDVFSGGGLRFPVCFEVPESESQMLLFSDSFRSDKRYFALAGEPVAASGLETLPGPQPGASATEQRLGPVPLGTVAEIGDGWSVSVIGYLPNATDLVLAENRFNDPPPAGHQMVFVDIEVTYNGPEESGNLFSPDFDAVGIGNLAYSDRCGVSPGELDYGTDVFPGGTVSGTICFIVPDEEVDSLVFYAAGGFGSDPVYFAVR